MWVLDTVILFPFATSVHCTNSTPLSFNLIGCDSLQRLCCPWRCWLLLDISDAWGGQRRPDSQPWWKRRATHLRAAREGSSWLPDMRPRSMSIRLSVRNLQLIQLMCIYIYINIADFNFWQQAKSPVFGIYWSKIVIRSSGYRTPGTLRDPFPQSAVLQHDQNDTFMYLSLPLKGSALKKTTPKYWDDFSPYWTALSLLEGHFGEFHLRNLHRPGVWDRMVLRMYWVRGPWGRTLGSDVNCSKSLPYAVDRRHSKGKPISMNLHITLHCSCMYV